MSFGTPIPALGSLYSRGSAVPSLRQHRAVGGWSMTVMRAIASSTVKSLRGRAMVNCSISSYAAQADSNLCRRESALYSIGASETSVQM